MKRALLVINVLLGASAVVVAVFVAREAVVLKYGRADAKIRPIEAKTPQAGRQLSDYAAITGSGLFGKGSLPAEGAEGADAAVSSSGLVLVGTAEGLGYAIFMDTATGRQKPFKVGESVFGAGSLATIGTKKAELTTPGGKVSFSVPSTITPAAGQAASQGAGPVASRAGEGRWVVDQRAVEGIFDNMDRVLTDARFTPYIDGGKLAGFQVSEVKTGGVFGLIGLNDGDVVLSINGYRLDSPGKVAQILGGLRGETEVKVDVLRGREPRTLRYQIR